MRPTLTLVTAMALALCLAAPPTVAAADPLAPASLPGAADVAPGWWIAIGGVAAAVLGVIGKVLDLRLFRDRDNAEFRRDLMRRIGKLEARDEEQQGIIDRSERTIGRLEREVARLRGLLDNAQQRHDREKRLKHRFFGKVNAAMLTLELYRERCGRLPDDGFEWDPDAETKGMDDDGDAAAAEDDEGD